MLNPKYEVTLDPMPLYVGPSIILAVAAIALLFLSGCAMTVVAGDNNGSLDQSVSVTTPKPHKSHVHTGLDRRGLDRLFQNAGEHQ